MVYEDIRPAVFVSRPNRFVAVIRTEAGEKTAHVMNTGRCRELLLPGAQIYVQRRRGEGRKTPFALVAVEKGERLINMDSQAPNAVWAEALAAGIPVPGFGEIAAFRRETVFGESRLDFRTESALGEGVMEIKGVTLEEDGVARFPDAPTQRGTRHLRELIRAAEQGMPAAAVFIIQMEGVRWFEPNAATDPAFARTLAEAAAAGVTVAAWDCAVTPDSLAVRQPVPVRLNGPYK